MICHAHSCIYIVQHKAASTSILAAFGVTGADRDAQVLNHGPRNRGWSKRPRGYFVFSSIRNPFDRALSAWLYLQGRPESRLRGVSIEAALRRKAYCPFDASHFARTQTSRLSGRSGKLVTDDLVRVESLQADFDRVCDRIGKPRVEMPRLNATAPHGPYRKMLSKTARALIEARFADDLKNFGYAW